MPQLAPSPVHLAEIEREQLQQLVNRHSTPQQIASRSRIILLADIADFIIIDYSQLLEISSDRTMKPYSLDFRKKIIETYTHETISQRKLAQRFKVATSVVTRLLKQHRETGQLDPKPQPGRPKTLKPDHFQVVQQLVSAQPDITLAELCQDLNDHIGIRVSEPTLSTGQKL